MHYKKYSKGFFFTLFLALFIHLQAFSQGCSDAGFCTMGAMRPNQSLGKKSSVHLRSVELLQYVGYTKFDDVILTTLVDLNASIGKRASVQLKLPYTIVTGPLANTNGTGDISYAFTYRLFSNDDMQILGTIGGKLPTNNANMYSSDGRPLPMYYQSSLGTYDAVAGISLITNHWLFATGYQHAFNTIENEFRWSQWTGSPLEAIALRYPQSWNLKRGDDIMFRIERNFRSTKWNGYLGLLNICRINSDNISKTETTRVSLTGTTGLAITALGGFGYKFTTRTTLKGMFGYKLTNRERNPDGLSREWVTSLSLEVKF